MRSSHALLCATGVLLAACGTKPIKQSDMHIQQTPDTVARSSGTIPQPSKQAVVLPPPKNSRKDRNLQRRRYQSSSPRNTVRASA